MSSPCHKITKMLSDFKELSLQEHELDAIEQHTNDCQQCLELFELNALSLPEASFEEAPFKAPASLKQNILRSMPSEKPSKSRLKLPWLLPAFSTSFAVATLCFAFIYTTKGRDQMDPEQTMLATTQKQPVLRVNQASHSPGTQVTSNNRPRTRPLRTQTPRDTQSQQFYAVPHFTHPSVDFEGWQENVNHSQRRRTFQYGVPGTKTKATIRVQKVFPGELDLSLFDKHQVKGKTMWARTHHSRHVVFVKSKRSKGLLVSSTMPVKKLLNIAATID